MNNSIKQAKEIIKNLLKNFPEVYCNDLSHSKADYHSNDEDCPVFKRYKDAISEAEKFLTLDKVISEE